MRSIAGFLTFNGTFLLVLTLAFFIRVYGINWDTNQHLHPDERFLTMVTQAIHFPDNPLDYFNTSTSTLNPHNVNFSFYVYGTFPLFFVKLFTEITKFTDYNQVTLLGRVTSTLFDLGTIIFIYLIGLKFSKQVGLLASFFYSISVLAIQLSHFYAVDTFLNFFMIGCVYLWLKYLETKKIVFLILSAVFLGLAEASKITGILVVPGLAVIFLITQIAQKRFKFSPFILIYPVVALVIFRIFQPYAFDNHYWGLGLNPKFLANLNELQNYAKPGIYFPPAINWNNTTPFYPLKEMIIWGLGIPLGIISLISIVYLFFYLIKKFRVKNPELNSNYLISFLIIFFTIFIYQSLQFGKPLRYFLPSLPYLTLFSAIFISSLIPKKHLFSLLGLILVICIIWPLAFLAIYTKPHSRITASEWIYQNIPFGSTLSVDHWDDGLPLSLPSNPANVYQFVEFPLFGEDIPEKWRVMSEKLAQADYLVITSNRLYGSITRNPQMYPLTAKFYDLLFSNQLGFFSITEFTSRPHIPLPFIKTCLNLPFSDYGTVAEINQRCDLEGITFVDDYVDETSTVYDHPKVIIFKKIKPLNYLQLIQGS